MEIQKKNILRTVIMIVVIMITILLLFLNKITTPRYLSVIELKINGLILLQEQERKNLAIDNQGAWVILYSNEAEQTVVKNLYEKLKPSIKKSTTIGFNDFALHNKQIDTVTANAKQGILIVNPEKQIIAYFKSPFDLNKMLLTYSSIVTHH